MAHRISNSDLRREIHIDAFGESVPARAGESVAAALLAAGRPVLSRSVKYHRPRGPFCLEARCSHCLVRIDGIPNRFACRTACQPDMRVEAQNVLGTARFDALSAIDFLFPRGLDHHSMFAGVPIVEGMVAGVARHLAGLGNLPDLVAPALPTATTRRVDVAIVGAGPAGLAAALACADAGKSVEIIDEHPQPGGHLLCGLAPPERLTHAVTPLRRPGVTFTLDALALGAYRDADGPFLAVRESQGPKVVKLYARRYLLCPGGTETVPPFDGNDTPGIFAARGLLRMIRSDGVVPGERAVVLAEQAEGLRIAEELAEAGCSVVAVVDPSGKLRHATLPVVAGRIEAASGGRLSHVKVVGPDGKKRAFSCDLLAVSSPIAPSFELARQMGLRADYMPGLGFSSTPSGGALPGVAIAGEAAGALGDDACFEQGATVARAIVAGPEVAQ